MQNSKLYISFKQFHSESYSIYSDKELLYLESAYKNRILCEYFQFAFHFTRTLTSYQYTKNIILDYLTVMDMINIIII
jgi:hypothetical protein